ncbi:hypothetical protein IRJ41_000384 [Triplophysa rosa]|uniref:Ig-like domain-containing protein n=1 Tax=Triplophysa rosa TaxID=992332 RepID=A0A9W7T3E1_TRIRA|nr:hypothetical protein IRJ41_000384 [Triplophysa rosa]
MEDREAEREQEAIEREERRWRDMEEREERRQRERQEREDRQLREAREREERWHREATEREERREMEAKEREERFLRLIEVVMLTEVRHTEVLLCLTGVRKTYYSHPLSILCVWGRAGLPKSTETFRSCCFICVFGLMINIYTADAVHRKTTAEGVTGDSVLLPCVTNKNEHNVQDIDVMWKYNDKQNVYEIIKGKSSVKDQEQKYKNRIDTFPEEFEKGNFSLKLNSLTHSDAGEYHCFIKHSHETVTIKLHIIGCLSTYLTPWSIKYELLMALMFCGVFI